MCQLMVLLYYYYISLLLPVFVASLNLNTDCESVMFKVDLSSPLTVDLGRQYNYKLSVTPSDTQLNNYAFTIHYDSGYRKHSIPFNELTIGSYSKAPRFNITLSRQGTLNWSFTFSDVQKSVTGYYWFQVGECTSNFNERLQIEIEPIQLTNNFSLNLPSQLMTSFKMRCPFDNSLYTLKVCYNSSETLCHSRSVYHDFPISESYFYPFFFTSTEPEIDYTCTAITPGFFITADYLIAESPSAFTTTAHTIKEEAIVDLNLTNFCQQVRAQFSSYESSLSEAYIFNGETLGSNIISQVLLRDNGSYFCQLTHPFFQVTWPILELTVKPLNACAHDNGGCMDICHLDIQADSYYCSCYAGYRLLDLYTCVDADECNSPQLNKCDTISQSCLNSIGSYICECKFGFIVDESNSSLCLDNDECLYSNGLCSHLCVNTIGSYHCECSDTSIMQDDNRTCTETLSELEAFFSSSMLIPVVFCLVFGVLLIVTVIIVLGLVISLCRKKIIESRRKFGPFPRSSGDFKFHQHVDNPAFKLTLTSNFPVPLTNSSRHASTASGNDSNIGALHNSTDGMNLESDSTDDMLPQKFISSKSPAFLSRENELSAPENISLEILNHQESPLSIAPAYSSLSGLNARKMLREATGEPTADFDILTNQHSYYPSKTQTYSEDYTHATDSGTITPRATTPVHSNTLRHTTILPSLLNNNNNIYTHSSNYSKLSNGVQGELSCNQSYNGVNVVNSNVHTELQQRFSNDLTLKHTYC